MTELRNAEGWNQRLQVEFEKPYFKDLSDFVTREYTRGICYPERDAVFAAFEACPFEEVKVVLIGQDPYHGKGQANGLCFSVAEGVKFPPSLVNIFKELEADLQKPVPDSGDLMRWAKQGVLLLNATLTVRAHAAGSHQKKGWEQFTDAVIQCLSKEKEGLVFLLWGGFAQKKGAKIDAKRHHLLSSGHPSPLSANRGYWFGNRHFSKTNALLEKSGQQKIDW